MAEAEGEQGLEDDVGGANPPWNKLTSKEVDSVLSRAREMPELSPRQLAAWTTDSRLVGSPSETDETVLSRKSAAAIMGAALPSRPLVGCGVPAHNRYGRASNPSGPEARGLSRGLPTCSLYNDLPARSSQYGTLWPT